MAYPYRPYKSVSTGAEIVEYCKKADLAASRTSDYLISDYRPPFTEYFVNKEYVFFFDHGSKLEYCFPEKHLLRWREQGGSWNEEYYEALESTAGEVFLIHHLRRDILPYGCTTLIVDLRTELVTWISMTLGTPECDRNVNRKLYFGYFGMLKEQRHAYTDELCGVILDWKYSESFIIRHEYVTLDWALSPGEPSENAEDYLFRKFLPAKYVKVRDRLYIMTFIEDGGTDICFLIDMKKLRNVGAFFGMGDQGRLACFTVGAKAGLGKFGFDGKYAIPYGPEGGRVP